MNITTTPRLTVRELTLDDADFVLQLLNEPSWIRFIGDKQVRTRADAEHYLSTGPLLMYQQHGFGMYLVAERDSNRAVGMCGLLKRAGLADVDIGFALSPAFWGQGYAFEAAQAVLEYGQKHMKLQRVVAITLPDNQASIRLLTKLGFDHEGSVQLPGETESLSLYGAGFQQ